MGREPVPWPVQTYPYYQEIYNKLVRAETRLETALCDAEDGNYLVWRSHLPTLQKLVEAIREACVQIFPYAPEGQGNSPKWLTTTRDIDKVSEQIEKVIPKTEWRIRTDRQLAAVHDAKVILKSIRLLRKQLLDIPPPNSEIIIGQSGFNEVKITMPKAGRFLGKDKREI